MTYLHYGLSDFLVALFAIYFGRIYTKEGADAAKNAKRGRPTLKKLTADIATADSRRSSQI
jgi:hypothetical protein